MSYRIFPYTAGCEKSVMPAPVADVRESLHDLRGQITRAFWLPGSSSATELELRDRYNASRNTVRDAIERLTARVWSQARPGQGTFVAMRLKPFVASCLPILESS